MSPSMILPIIAVCLVSIHGGLVIAGLYWVRRRRKTKWPFKKSDRLLRAPGESLRRLITSFDERFAAEFFGGTVTAVVAFYLAGSLLRLASGLSPTVVLLLASGSFLLVSAFSVWRIISVWRKRTALFHGWYGERMVADAIAPLAIKGYHIFHDVPAEGREKDFNLDHVIVGPTGVTVIETKTRRKWRGQSADKDFVVKFDGRCLQWPWGEDSSSTRQAINCAVWLREWIESHTGLRVPVRPILTLPGWEVDERHSTTIRVVKLEFLIDAIHGHGKCLIRDDQIDLIARQLDLVCRDVED